MKRILLTGVTGKSGADLVRRLKQKSDDFPYTLRATVRTEMQAEWLHSMLPMVEVCIGDLCDTQYLDRIMQNVDIVFHIAGIGWSDSVAQAASKHGVQRMILVHTTGIYSKYKAAGAEYRRIEARVDELAEQYGISVTYLRPSMIYGTPSDGNMIQFIKMVDRLNPMPLVNHGRYSLQPVNYQDLGCAYLQILEQLDTVNGREYILSGKDSMLLCHMLQEIASCLSVKRKFFSVPFPIAYGGHGWYIC